MTKLLVDRVFEEPLTDEALAAMKVRSEDCYRLHRVTRICTYVSSDRLHATCVFEAADAESVRQANEMANLPFLDVWVADEFDVPG